MFQLQFNSLYYTTLLLLLLYTAAAATTTNNDVKYFLKSAVHELAIFYKIMRRSV